MDISSSSRTCDSQSDSSIVDNTTNVNTVTTASTPESSIANQNESSHNNIANISSESSDIIKTITEPSQPTITITPQPQNDSSLVLILDEVPPPPYPTDSNIQILTPSHSRDHTTITLTSPPEYTSSEIITTQPQPQIMSLSPYNNRFSDISTTNTTNEDISNRALLNSAQQSKFCKICQESEESGSSNALDSETYEKGKLISPCKCKGSLQYVHIGCLNQWRHSNVRAEASYRCEVCKYEYRFYRTRIAKIFSSSFTLHFLTLTLLLSIIYLISYIVKLILHNNVSYDPNDPNNDPPHKLPGEDNYNRWKEIEFLNIRVIEYIIGISIVSCFGLIFFVIMICFNGFSHTRHSYCFIGGFNNSCCLSYGGCSGSDCSDNDCSGFIVIIFFFIISIIFMVGFVGATIAAYLLIQKITSICLEKVHDRILEVNKG